MAKFSAEEVYDIVQQIPRGKVISYGEIAALMGLPHMSRQVGRAMHNAYMKGLPCHRVVFADGGLAPGWAAQAALLKAEGVMMKKNGKVNMQKSAWRPLDTMELL